MQRRSLSEHLNSTIKLSLTTLTFPNSDAAKVLVGAASGDQLLHEGGGWGWVRVLPFVGYAETPSTTFGAMASHLISCHVRDLISSHLISSHLISCHVACADLCGVCGDAEDHVGVSLECLDQLLGLQVPHVHSAVLRAWGER